MAEEMEEVLLESVLMQENEGGCSGEEEAPKSLSLSYVSRGTDGLENSDEEQLLVNPSKDTYPESTPPISRIGLNDHKAGMQGLNKVKINEVILEASKGSKYYNNEVKKEKQVSLRIKQMMSKMKDLTEAQKASALRTVDRDIEVLESTRDLSRIIVHVDMDAFYAAVEIKDNPKLRDVPMAVGGNSMLSTSNYVARKFGVRAAMPGFIARKLCPDLVMVPPNYAKYTAVGEEVREVLYQYDPSFSPVGLDESFLDITDFVLKRHSEADSKANAQAVIDLCLEPLSPDEESYSQPTEEDSVVESPEDQWEECGVPAHLLSVAQDVVREMRAKIEEKTQLTASAGIAPNKMLAKVASDLNKPNGQFFLSPTREAVLDFVQKLPIRKIPGIGKVTERLLNALGITTCTDLYTQRAALSLLFSPVSSQHFLRVCLGLGSTEVDKDYQRKSISTERTFAEISKPEELMAKCKKLCDKLSESLSEEGLKGRTVTLKIKTSDFRVSTRALSGKSLISTSEDLFSLAGELLQVEITQAGPNPLCLRLMGVRLSNLEESSSRNIKSFFKKIDPSRPSSDCAGIGDELLENDVVTVSDTDSNLSPVKRDPAASTSRGEETLGTDDLVECGERHEESEGVSFSSLTENVRKTNIECPLCGAAVSDDNLVLNQHIDICLNRDTVFKVVQELGHSSTSPQTPKSSKAAPVPGNRKRKESDPSCSSGSNQKKRSKTQTKLKLPSSKNPLSKLDQYFRV